MLTDKAAGRGVFQSQDANGHSRTPASAPAPIMSPMAFERLIGFAFLSLPIVLLALTATFLWITFISEHHRRVEYHRRRAELEQYHQYLLGQYDVSYDTTSNNNSHRSSYNTLGTISEYEGPSGTGQHVQNSLSDAGTRQSASSVVSATTYVDFSSDPRIPFRSSFWHFGRDEVQGGATPQHQHCNSRGSRQQTPAISPQTCPLRDRLKYDEGKLQKAIAFVRRQTSGRVREEDRRRSSSVGERELRFLKRAFQAAEQGTPNARPAVPQLIRTSTRSCEDLLHGAGRMERFFAERAEKEEHAGESDKDSVGSIEFLRI